MEEHRYADDHYLSINPLEILAPGFMEGKTVALRTLHELQNDEYLQRLNEEMMHVLLLIANYIVEIIVLKMIVVYSGNWEGVIILNNSSLSFCNIFT